MDLRGYLNCSSLAVSAKEAPKRLGVRELLRSAGTIIPSGVSRALALLRSLSVYGGWSAEAIESAGEVTRDGVGIAAFDIAPLEHEHHFSIAHQGDGRRRRRVFRK